MNRYRLRAGLGEERERFGRPRNPGTQPPSLVRQSCKGAEGAGSVVTTFPSSDSMFLLSPQASSLAGPARPISMKLLCLVAVVGCLLVPPAQANKVREVGQLHLVALAPGLLGCHRGSQSATLTPPPSEDPPWGRGPYLGQAAGLPKGCREHRVLTKLALGEILRKQEKFV